MNIFLKLTEGIRDLLGGLGLSVTSADLITVAISTLLFIVFILLNVLMCTYWDRKLSAFMQDRYGPNRLGPKGLFQAIADTLKLIGKETYAPNKVDKWVYNAAAVTIFVPPVLAFAAVPFAKDMVLADLNLGIFYILAIGSLATISMIMAGWGSNNKFSMVASMRMLAVMITYEIPLAFALLGVVMLVGSLKLGDIVEAQKNVWFIIPQILGAAVYFTASIAEVNRTPFDQHEADQELVAGVQTEYSGMRWGLLYLTEYIHVLLAAAVFSSLFLGGYQPLFGLDIIPGYIWLVLKIHFMYYVFNWIRFTWVRARIDHMMSFGWKVLIPVSLVNVLLTGVGIYVYELAKGVL